MPHNIVELICTSSFDTILFLSSYEKIWSKIRNCYERTCFLRKMNYIKRIKETTISIRTNVIKWKIVILENIRKKYHQILSFHSEEISNYRFKFGIKNRNELVLCSSRNHVHCRIRKRGVEWIHFIATIERLKCRYSTFVFVLFFARTL